ncbi:MAG: bifunctional phosphoribosyl-AMP cyclohydrolase/phosphoribosyl-ATP diphosphatase HisIE, partial [Saprospiraceae bacterium]|nr:bifunctional phosphoribosyl-AMP cyclohydrolase/phosphoribosyl-ATP diphosphatase HisIE [Saprospiraceae bacterium]
STVLMLGYQNEQAFEKTISQKRVRFYSRSKERLWMKGESSGNALEMVSYHIDCDADTILIKALPKGPVCHKGTQTCFKNNLSSKGSLYHLEDTIAQRIVEGSEASYTSKLYNRGINKVAQKVGEEAVELVIEAKDDNEVLFKNEAADLLYHFLILLKAKDLKLEDIEQVLLDRSKP